MKIGEAIKTFRERKELTEEELGAQIGIHPAVIVSIERGAVTPSKETLGLMQKELGVPAPFIAFLSMEESDIVPEKKAFFNELAPTIRDLILDTEWDKKDEEPAPGPTKL